MLLEVEHMHFEAREPKPYAEPVPPDELTVGKVYFAVNFIDEEMLIPTMEPMVFIGRDLEPELAGRFYFQDVDSYREGARFEPATGDNEAIFVTATVKHIFDYEKALDVLMSCALRRRKVAG